MGLGETQVFQDEKSRLANTTVARIVAAKGSLEQQRKTHPLDETASGGAHPDGHSHGAAPGDVPGEARRPL